MRTLLARLVRPRRKADPRTFTVYSRQHCCCCHQALDLLDRYRRRHRFTIEVIDVDTDLALVARHGEWVPVVEVDGKVRFRAKVNPVLLDRLFATGAAVP
jgi:hypothetical protein